MKKIGNTFKFNLIMALSILVYCSIILPIGLTIDLLTGKILLKGKNEN